MAVEQVARTPDGYRVWLSADQTGYVTAPNGTYVLGANVAKVPMYLIGQWLAEHECGFEDLVRES